MANGKLVGDELIKGMDGETVCDFWSWAYSDILSNRNRSILAEFIVGSGLGVTSSTRTEWHPFDLLFEGKKIEVKSSGYLQSWQQKGFSKITFDISKKYQYGADGLSSRPDPEYPIRPSDCYVFSLYAKKDQENVDVLDISEWEFYVLSTDYIDENFGNQKTISLNVLRSHCNNIEYEEIKGEVRRTCRILEEHFK